MTTSDPPVKVLHVMGRMLRAGAELRNLDILRNIDRSRFVLHFCALSGLPGTLDEEIRGLGGEVHLCGLGPSFPRRLRRLLRAERYRVVHSHVYYSSGYILKVAHACQVPVRVAHFRNTADGQSTSLRRRLQRAWMRRCIERHATSILANARAAMVESWRSDWTADPRCQVIPNGLDVSSFRRHEPPRAARQDLRVPHDAPLCIHVGRFDPPKNHERLLSMFDQLRCLEPEVRLLLVGRGGNAIEQTIRERVAKLALADRVLFAGERSDVARLLLASDLMIFPSLHEGAPGAVLEAAAIDLPILASDLSSTRELAESLPAMRLLALDRPDSEWAAEAQRLIRSPAKRLPLEAALRRFEGTPYEIGGCARRHCEVWSAAG